MDLYARVYKKGNNNNDNNNNNNDNNNDIYLFRNAHLVKHCFTMT